MVVHSTRTMTRTLTKKLTNYQAKGRVTDIPRLVQIFLLESGFSPCHQIFKFVNTKMKDEIPYKETTHRIIGVDHPRRDYRRIIRADKDYRRIIRANKDYSRIIGVSKIILGLLEDY